MAKDVETEMVSGHDLRVDDWFWDSDGDLTYVEALVTVTADDEGNEFEDEDKFLALYWSAYKKYDGVPDLMPTPRGDDSFHGNAIHHDKDSMYERIIFFEPVSDDDVEAAMASILATMGGKT